MHFTSFLRIKLCPRCHSFTLASEIINNKVNMVLSCKHGKTWDYPENDNTCIKDWNALCERFEPQPNVYIEEKQEATVSTDPLILRYEQLKKDYEELEALFNLGKAIVESQTFTIKRLREYNDHLLKELTDNKSTQKSHSNRNIVQDIIL